MIRIMVMNGLLISLILIWTSAAKEPSAGYLIKSSTKPPTGPLNYSVSKPMVSLHETNKEILRRKFLCGSELGGVCVNKKKSCPSNLPSEKSPGKPYCSKKKDRCCYPDPTTAAPPTVVPTTTTTSEDVNWSDIRNACIKSNNYKTYQPLALDICKEKCVEEDAINCQSIEYSSAQQMCAISEARSDSEDFIEPCFVDGWVFAEIELNAGPTTGAPTTLAPSNTTINGQTTNPPTTTAPSNTTNNVSSCNLVWNYEEDRPLIMIRETKTIVPPIIDIEISEDPNRIPEGKKLIFACPGENNQFNHVQGTHTKLHGECISHEQFKVCVNNYPEILDLSQLSCSSKMQPSIIKQDNDTSYEKSCEDIGGELYKFGYIYGDYREFKDLDTKFCFREKDQTTLWTSTNIDRIEISPSMRSMDPANFRTARGLAMNTFYSQKSQQETLKEILDKEVTSVWNDKACRNHGGHCVRGGRPCPKHLPHHTSQGEPFCTSFYRCCYSDQCDPTTCTYKGKKGNCSLDSLPGTTGVGSQECKKGCQCYIKDNKTLRQFKILQEQKEFSKLLRVSEQCGGGVGQGTCTSFQSQKVRSNQRMMHIERAITWHPTGKCGSHHPLPDGSPGQCKADGAFPCCDPISGDCMICPCVGCFDYRDPWLPSGRCGPHYPLQNDKPSQCNPNGQHPCCNPNTGSCGNTPQFCTCNGCIDYRDCNLEWEPRVSINGVCTYVGRAPLVFEIIGIINTILTNSAINGRQLRFSCPGRNNVFQNTNYGQHEDLECRNGKLVRPPPIQSQVDLHDLGCRFVMRPSVNPIMNTNVQPIMCGPSDNNIPGINIGKMFRIEYEIIHKPDIQVCFNENQKTTLWTLHTIDGSNVQWHHGKSGDFEDVYGRWGVYAGINTFQFNNIGINDIYSVENQKDLNALYGTNIDDENIQLQRGHMAPKGDFVTPAEQLATLVFVNAMPQWKSINIGNWKQIEYYTRWLAACLRENLQIYTGTYNVMTFYNIGIYLGVDGNGNEIVPVPEITWKVVYTGTAGVAFVVYNYPEEPDTILHHYADWNRCNELNWLYITPTRLNSRVYGRTYCFTVRVFRTNFPRIDFPLLPGTAETTLLTQ